MTLSLEFLLSLGTTLVGAAAIFGYARSQLIELARRTTVLETSKASKEVVDLMHSELKTSFQQVLDELSHLQDLIRTAIGGPRDR